MGRGGVGVSVEAKRRRPVKRRINERDGADEADAESDNVQAGF